MIIGFLRSPRWKTPVMSFLDEYCTVFDDEDENKFEFTKIHKVRAYTYVQANLYKGLQKNCRRFIAGVNE